MCVSYTRNIRDSIVYAPYVTEANDEDDPSEAVCGKITSVLFFEFW